MPENKAIRPKNDANYKIVVGTFKNNSFTWHDVSEHTDFDSAYKAYKKYVEQQLKYTDEELKKVWDTGRIDVELLRGQHVLNWIGIYTHEVSDRIRYGEDKE